MANERKKANSVLTSKINDNGTITLTVLGAGEVHFNPATVNDTLRKRAELHGWIQRLSDGAALSRDPDTGESPSAQDKLEHIQAIAAHYLNGAETWNMRAGSGGGGSESGLTLRAVARVYGYDLATAGEKLDALAVKRGMDRKKLLSHLRGNEKVIAAMNAIRAEAAQGAGVDSDELLGELAPLEEVADPEGLVDTLDA